MPGDLLGKGTTSAFLDREASDEQSIPVLEELAQGEGELLSVPNVPGTAPFNADLWIVSSPSSHDHKLQGDEQSETKTSLLAHSYLLPRLENSGETFSGRESTSDCRRSTRNTLSG
jgi:hypothetical protein